MPLDYVVSGTRKDESRTVFDVYGQPQPHRNDVIALPADGESVIAKIDTPATDTAAAVGREI